MRYLKKIISFLLSLCISLSFLPGTVEASQENYRWITKREEVDGSDFTSSVKLAAVLNDIFDGNANVYYDAEFTRMVETKLGTSRVPNNGVNRYVGPYGDQEDNVGTSCWIYANGVYFTLFGECTGNGEAGVNSEKLELKGSKNYNFSYENFVSWGVRPEPGALIRTRCGHSLVILDYDQDYVTILDGNGNGRGLIAIRKMKWDCQTFRAKYIIQPTQMHFDILYSI